MSSAGATLSWMGRARQPSPENAEITRAVLEVAAGWQAGALPLAGVRSLCTGYERFVAMNHVPAGADRELLARLLDALVAEQGAREGAYQTRQGRFTRADLEEHGGIVVRGQIVWPSAGRPGHWRYRDHGER